MVLSESDNKAFMNDEDDDAQSSHASDSKFDDAVDVVFSKTDINLL